MIKSKGRLKNYTTTIPIEKTIQEIEQILAKFGARSIYKMYDTNGEPTGLAFEVMVNEKPLGFKLPMRNDKVFQVFKNQNVEPRYKNMDQAKRTGWRIIKDWIDSQTAMMNVELVKLEEVFLPFLYDKKSDKTFFEMMEKKEFNLQLEGGNLDENKQRIN